MNTDITTTFKNYVNNGGTLHYRATLTLNNSSKTTLQLGDNDFLQDTWEFQYDSCEGDFAIGGAVPSQFKCTLNNLTGKFTNYVSYLDGGTITVYLQSVKEIETYNEKTCLVTKTFTKDEEFCWGTFVVNVDFQHYETIDLQCYDRLYLLQETDLLTYLNSLADSKKFAKLSAATVTNVVAKLKTWLQDFGITNLVFSGSLDGVFLLSKEFFASTYTPTTIYPRTCFSSTLTEKTSQYDMQVIGDSKLWEGKSLLDFVRCFAQVMGMFCYMGSDGKTLYMTTYANKTTITATIRTGVIKELTYSPQEYTTQLRNCCVMTSDTNIPVKRLPTCLYNSYTRHLRPWIQTTKQFEGPVSTGGYKLTNHAISENNYLTIENNPLITYPIGDINWREKNSTLANPIYSYCFLYYNILKDLNWYACSDDLLCTAHQSTPTYIGGDQIVGNLYSADGKGNNAMDNKRIREFSCNCEPQLGFRIGQMLTFSYKTPLRTTTFSSLVNHITFKPNVSMNLSLTFDKNNASKISDGLCCDSDKTCATSFRQFYEGVCSEIVNCYKSVAGNQIPNITYKNTKKEGKYTSYAGLYQDEPSALLRLYTETMGEMLGSYKLQQTTSGVTVTIKPVKNT